MVKITGIVDKIGSQEMDSVKINIPLKYRLFVHIGNSTEEGQYLVIPHDLFVEMCKEAENESYI